MTLRVLCIAMILLAPLAAAQVTAEDKNGAITVKEGDNPVLVYHYKMVEPPRIVPDRYARLGYIHPLYGLDGEVLTQDFPLDHFHHRGVFWAWPDSDIGGKRIDVWALDGAREVHTSDMRHEVNAENGSFTMENAWVLDDDPETAIIRETVTVQPHPEQNDARAIDITLTFENVSDEVFTLRGATTDDKGYGGFCFRPDATRRPMHFTTDDGPIADEDDQLEYETPWMDVSFSTERKGETLSGVAIFQHPGNPGYPHDGWIARHYGFLGQSWPHRDPYEMKPGDEVTLRYRLYIHRGDAEAAEVAEAYAAYKKEITGAGDE
jgi:hypothetical protein